MNGAEVLKWIVVVVVVNLQKTPFFKPNNDDRFVIR